MLNTAFNIQGPVAIRYPRGAGEGLQIAGPPRLLEPGRGRIIEKGDDLAIIAVGRGVSIGSEVRKLLVSRGISVGLLDARFIKPLDSKMICRAALHCERVLCIEDNCLVGGFGSALLELLEDNNIKAEVLRVGIPDEFVEHGRLDQLLEFLNMDPESIVDTVITRWPGLLKNGRIWGLLNFGKN